MYRGSFTYTLIVAWALCSLWFPLHASSAGQDEELSIGVPLFTGEAPVGEDFIVRLNDVLRPDDILFVRGGPAFVELLRKVKRGRVAIVRQSIAALKEDLEYLRSRDIQVAYLCYNHEAGKASLTPQEEKDDPVRAVRDASRLAQMNGLKLIVSPDTSTTLLAYGAEMAGYADILVMQLEQWQRGTEEDLQSLVRRTVRWLKMGNPDIIMYAQFSSHPPAGRNVSDKKEEHADAGAEDMLRKVKSVEGMIKGAIVLLKDGDAGRDRFFEFSALLRPGL